MFILDVIFLDIMTQGQIILIAYASLCLKAYLGKGMTYFALRVLFGFVLCILVYFFRQNDTKGQVLIFFNICLVETKVSSWQKNDRFSTCRLIGHGTLCPYLLIVICTLISFCWQGYFMPICFRLRFSLRFWT